MINNTLKEYIETNIIKEYAKNDLGHSFNHVNSVIENSLELAIKLNLNIDIAYTIAAFHDIGHHIDALNHEIVSANIMRKDEFINNYFNKEEIKIIYEAISDHRASKEAEPRNIYGKVVASADRTMDLDELLERCYHYGTHHFPQYDQIEQIDRIYDHLSEKFGEDGYSTTYFETEKQLKMKKELGEIIKDEDLFKIALEKIIKRVN